MSTIADPYSNGDQSTAPSQAPLFGKPVAGLLPRSFGLWMAAFYVGIFIIRPWEKLFPELGPLHFERFFAIFVIASVGLSCGFRVKLSMQNVSVLGMVSAVGLSSVMAQDLSLSWPHFYTYLTLVACYVILVSVIRTPYDLIFIVVAYIGFMELYLGKALWEFFIHGAGRHAQGVLRLTGIETTYGDVNRLAGSIVISLPFWLFLWRCRNEFLIGWPVDARRWVLIALALYPALGILSIILTNSRTGMLNLCVFVLFAGARGAIARSLRNMLIGSLLLVIGWVVMPIEQQQRLRTIWDPASANESARESAEGRFFGFMAGVQMFKQHPITGVGPGNFGPYRAQNIDGSSLLAHNLYGEIIGELGAIGIVAFACFLIPVIIAYRRTRIFDQVFDDVNLRVLAGVAQACCFSIILMFVEGLGLHNVYRYNWLWVAAFSTLAMQFALQIFRNADFFQS